MFDPRYLTFEIGDTCGLAALHPRCPVSDPDRYVYGQRDRVLDDAAIMRVWQWAHGRGFRGVVLWHLYNEPMAQLPRIQSLVRRMRATEPTQRTHLWSGLPASKRAEGFDHVVHTDYAVVRPHDLDNRRASVRGDGDYALAPKAGRCGRGAWFEVIIDNRGNWLLCCNDWRCEESVGNIFDDDLDAMCARHASILVSWDTAESFYALPRLCRACVTVNPGLHRTAIPPPGKVDWQ